MEASLDNESFHNFLNENESFHKLQCDTFKAWMHIAQPTSVGDGASRTYQFSFGTRKC